MSRSLKINRGTLLPKFTNMITTPRVFNLFLLISASEFFLLLLKFNIELLKITGSLSEWIHPILGIILIKVASVAAFGAVWHAANYG